MADCCTSSIDEQNSIQKNDTENTSMDEKPDVVITSNGKRNKPQLTPEQYHQLTDKLLEIEQIKCEEYLVREQINHLNNETQHLQTLLNILHNMDSNDRMRNARYRQRRLQKNNSDSHFN